MDTRKGVVQKIDDHQAWILARREGACGDCSHGGCCAAVNGQDRILVKAINEVGAQPGDNVRFYMRESIKLKWMAVLFAFPVFGAILGAWIGNAAASVLKASPDGIVAAVTVAGFAAGLVLVRLLANSRHALKELTPIIVDRRK